MSLPTYYLPPVQTRNVPPKKKLDADQIVAIIVLLLTLSGLGVLIAAFAGAFDKSPAKQTSLQNDKIPQPNISMPTTTVTIL
jgi:hypothetical protein